MRDHPAHAQLLDISQVHLRRRARPKPRKLSGLREYTTAPHCGRLRQPSGSALAVKTINAAETWRLRQNDQNRRFSAKRQDRAITSKPSTPPVFNKTALLGKIRQNAKTGRIHRERRFLQKGPTQRFSENPAASTIFEKITLRDFLTIFPETPTPSDFRPTAHFPTFRRFSEHARSAGFHRPPGFSGFYENPADFPKSPETSGPGHFVGSASFHRKSPINRHGPRQPKFPDSADKPNPARNGRRARPDV